LIADGYIRSNGRQMAHLTEIKLDWWIKASNNDMVYYEDTFSHVVKAATIRTVLSIVVY
jgi:hypothetical protein